MTASVILSQATEIYILDATDTGNEVRKLTGLTSIGEIGGDTNQIDVTNLDSTAKEFVNGLTDNGAFTLGYDYQATDASQTTMKGHEGGANIRLYIALSESATQPTYSAGYTLPTDRTTLDMTVAVTSMTKGAGTDDVWRGSVNLKVSGAITETAAS